MDTVEACIDVPRKKRRSARGGAVASAGSDGAEAFTATYHTPPPSGARPGRPATEGGEATAVAEQAGAEVLDTLSQSIGGRMMSFANTRDGGPSSAALSPRALSRNPFTCYEIRGTWARQGPTTSVLRIRNEALQRLVGEQDVVFKDLLTPEHLPLSMNAFQRMFSLGYPIKSFVARVDWRLEGKVVPMVMAVDVRYEHGRPIALDQYASVVNPPGDMSEVAYSATVELPDRQERHVPVAYFVTGRYGPDLYSVSGDMRAARVALQIAATGSASPAGSAPSSPGNLVAHSSAAPEHTASERGSGSPDGAARAHSDGDAADGADDGGTERLPPMFVLEKGGEAPAVGADLPERVRVRRIAPSDVAQRSGGAHLGALLSAASSPSSSPALSPHSSGSASSSPSAPGSPLGAPLSPSPISIPAARGLSPAQAFAGHSAWPQGAGAGAAAASQYAAARLLPPRDGRGRPGSEDARVMYMRGYGSGVGDADVERTLSDDVVAVVARSPAPSRSPSPPGDKGGVGAIHADDMPS